MNNEFNDVDYWKAIILYGLNNATYKIALGKTLLELTDYDKNTVDWHLLSKHFLDNYIYRISEKNMPQQGNPSRRTVMERIVAQLTIGSISYDEAIIKVGMEAFNDVIPRFHNIGRNKVLLDDKFYHFEQGSKLHIHDSLFMLKDNRELEDELDSRWSLLEGAFKIGNDNWELANDIRDIYIKDGYSRINITNNIPFLNGYQGNVCFYCGEELDMNDIHVDHVLPRQVLQHDEIWNLVLSHSLCNLHKDDSLVSKHYIDKLIIRNENIMGSNHPWKKRISDSLGVTKKKRMEMTIYHYDNVGKVLGYRYWENSPNYNRETDPFYKKLITLLNK